MHAEDAVNVRLISDTNLDVRLVTKSRVDVNMFAFRKNAANCIKRVLAILFSGEMDEVDYGAVEFAKIKIIAAEILWHLGT